MAALAKEVAEVLGEPDHPVGAALLSLLALDAALRFAGDEAVELAERACAAARRHDDWLRTGPWLAWLLSSLIADRHDTVMVAAQEAFERAIAENDAFAIAEWHAELGVAHWMAGDFEEAQRLTEIGLTLAEGIGADNLVMRNAFLRGASLLVPGSDAAIALEYFKRAVRLGERVGGNVLYGGAAWAMLLFNRGEENVERGGARTRARRESRYGHVRAELGRDAGLLQRHRRDTSRQTVRGDRRNRCRGLRGCVAAHDHRRAISPAARLAGRYRLLRTASGTPKSHGDGIRRRPARVQRHGTSVVRAERSIGRCRCRVLGTHNRSRPRRLIRPRAMSIRCASERSD